MQRKAVKNTKKALAKLRDEIEDMEKKAAEVFPLLESGADHR